MRLSDIMSQMGLAGYAELGLVIFFVVFLIVGLRVLLLTDPAHASRALRLPLADDSEPSPRKDGAQ